MRNRSKWIVFFGEKTRESNLRKPTYEASLNPIPKTNRSNRSTLNRSSRFFFAAIQFSSRTAASFLPSCNLLRLLRFVTSPLCKRVYAPFSIAAIRLRFNAGGAEW